MFDLNRDANGAIKPIVPRKPRREDIFITVNFFRT